MRWRIQVRGWLLNSSPRLISPGRRWCFVPLQPQPCMVATVWVRGKNSVLSLPVSEGCNETRHFDLLIQRAVGDCEWVWPALAVYRDWPAVDECNYRVQRTGRYLTVRTLNDSGVENPVVLELWFGCNHAGRAHFRCRAICRRCHTDQQPQCRFVNCARRW